ncbi:MAG TPA: hypothetical protein ENG95_05925 [Nitrospirae bacterium]|nr:hypothetical protein [Nitrospirota bacterium]
MRAKIDSLKLVKILLKNGGKLDKGCSIYININDGHMEMRPIKSAPDKKGGWVKIENFYCEFDDTDIDIDKLAQWLW